MYCEFAVLRRCCFCMPLRKSLIVFGILNILFCIYMIAYSFYFMNADDPIVLVVSHSALKRGLDEITVVVYSIDLVATSLFVYGAIKKALKYLKVFYYYSITMTVVLTVFEIMDCTLEGWDWFYDETMIAIIGLMIEVYLIILVRSLIKKLEVSGPAAYQNPLHPEDPEGHQVYSAATELPTIV